jgi:hypothetical protein
MIFFTPPEMISGNAEKINFDAKKKSNSLGSTPTRNQGHLLEL